MDYILDTNIVLNFVRNSATFQALNEKYHFFAENNYSFISIVTAGEIYALARKNQWGENKRNTLTQMLEKLSVVAIEGEKIVQIYSLIDAYSQGKLGESYLPKTFSARNMGKNDIWIAATANIIGAKLVTLDKDFDHLADVFISILTV